MRAEKSYSTAGKVREKVRLIQAVKNEGVTEDGENGKSTEEEEKVYRYVSLTVDRTDSDNHWNRMVSPTKAKL